MASYGGGNAYVDNGPMKSFSGHVPKALAGQVAHLQLRAGLAPNALMYGSPCHSAAPVFAPVQMAGPAIACGPSVGPSVAYGPSAVQTPAVQTYAPSAIESCNQPQTQFVTHVQQQPTSVPATCGAANYNSFQPTASLSFQNVVQPTFAPAPSYPMAFATSGAPSLTPPLYAPPSLLTQQFVPQGFAPPQAFFALPYGGYEPAFFSRPVVAAAAGPSAGLC